MDPNRNQEQDQTGIYEDHNVGLSLAHLKKILDELKYKNYRF